MSGSGEGLPPAAGARLRLGVVSFLNAAPLAWGLEADPAFEILRELPSRVADRLHAGEIDLGTIPSIEYARGDYAIVPGVAIASRGPVRSVCLYHRGSLDAVRRVALDAASRTSAALVRILLRERLGRDPEYLEGAKGGPEDLGSADAALVIGDPALDYEGPLARLDLGSEWTARTGLPFVYAVWAGPRGPVTAAHVARLQRALAEGRGSLGEVARSYNGRDPSRRADGESYLRENIVFDLGEAELMGLREFYRRAATLGLISEVPELRFHGHL